MRTLFALLMVAAAALPAGAASKSAPNIAPQPTNIKIVMSWGADVSAAEFEALPSWIPALKGGYVCDEAAFTALWSVLKPGTIPPKIDFTKHMVVFAARDSAYEQLFVAKVDLKDGVAEVVANGYPGGQSRPDRLAIAAAVIPKFGIQFLKVGGKEAFVQP